MAVCEDRNDPYKLGRCRVRIFGLHSEDKTLMPTSDLPWAYPVQPITSAAMSGIGHSPVGPVEGTWVMVTFMDPDQQQPIMLGTIGGIPQNRGNIFVKDDEVMQMNSETGKVESVSSADVSSTQNNAPSNTITDGSGNPVRSGSGGYAVSGENDPNEVKVATINIKTAKLEDILPMADQIKLREALKQKESSGNYKAVNQFGYVGAYQMGAPMLTDLRYVKGAQSNSRLKEDKYWTGKNGITSLESWYNNSAEQDKACLEEFIVNFRYLKLKGALNEQTTGPVLAGLLASAHLVGAGGASKLTKGITIKDGNSVSSVTYYRLGYKAVTGVEPATLPSTEFENLGTTAANSTVSKPTTTPTNSELVNSREQAMIDSRFGFKDPNNRYPIATLLKEPDTNRLARNQNINETIVGDKKTARKLQVPLANSEASWNQPNPPYAAIYPYNHVYATETGHVMEFDDTPNAERIHLYHNSGTFFEWDDNGTQVQKIVGDNYTICARNNNVTIEGDCNITINGNANVYVVNNVELQVDGNVHGVVKNNVDLEVHGDVKGRIGGRMDLSVTDALHVKCKEFKLETTDGTIDLIGAKDINQDAPNIYMNSGKSGKSDKTIIPKYELGKPYPPQLTKLTEVERIPEDNMVYETPEEGDPSAWIETRIENNEITKEEAETKPTPIETDGSTKKYVEPVIVLENKSFEGLSEIPMSTRLSPNFTLADFCQKGKRKLISQGGLSVDQLALNMQNVAINTLEPILAKFPGFIITSGYRYAGQPAHSSKTSAHNTGEAVDIQFTGSSLSDYYDKIIQIKNIIAFDQLLLEYTSKGGFINTAWIHISFKKSGNRNMVFTMKDHKRVSDIGKIVKLA